MQTSKQQPDYYRVMINCEEQYSFWPIEKDLPDGWSGTGVTGTKSECLSYIEEVWTDLRPLSVRRATASNR